MKNLMQFSTSMTQETVILKMSPIFQLSSQFNLYLNYQIFIMERKLRWNQKSNAMFEIKNPRNPYFDCNLMRYLQSATYETPILIVLSVPLFLKSTPIVIIFRAGL